MKAVPFFKTLNLALVCAFALSVVPVHAMLPQEQAPANDAEHNANNQNAQNGDDTNWVTTALGATAVGGALWRLISHVKPSLDGTMEQKLNDRVVEFESRQLALKQVNTDICLCDELVKQAQAARDHGNSMHFVAAVWSRAKNLDAISNLPFDDIKKIDSYISNNNAQEIVDFLTNTVKPLLVPKQTEAQKLYDAALAAKKLATKKANQSTIGLLKNGITKDCNWLTSWFGMKFISHDEDELQPKKQLPRVVEEKEKNIASAHAIPASERKEYNQACAYFSGLSHIEQEARKAMNNNQVKHARGWLITDLFNANKCNGLRSDLSDQEKKRLQEYIARFEGAFEAQDQAVRKRAIAHHFNELKTVLGELKANTAGVAAKACIERFNEKLVQNPIPKKVRPKKAQIASQEKEKGSPVKEDSVQRAQPQVPEASEEGFMEQPDFGLESIVGPAVQWVKNNPLLGLSLAALTVVGVMAEVRGTWPYNNQEPAPVQQ